MINFLKSSMFALLGLAGFVPSGRSGEKTLNVLSFGARGDGVTLNTSFIQAAIDSATAMGGGVVVVPRGKFLSGTLVLKSNVTLQLREGATILGSINPADYQHLAFILAEGQENISITGKGTIDGQGRQLALYLDSLFYAGKLDSSQYNLRRKRPENRPGDLKISDCKNVHVSGITVKNACGWVQTYRLCEDLVIDSIRVESDAYWNNDGIDIADCKKVRITHCFVNSADDGICLKSEDGADHWNEDIYIADCTVRSSGSAIKLGTSSVGGFKKVRVRNIHVYDTFRSAIALESVDGGDLEDIDIDHIVATNTGDGIFIRLGQRNKNGKAGTLRNVAIRNVKVQIPFDRPDKNYDLRGPDLPFFHNPFPCSITGIPGHPVENVTLENIEITFPGRGNDGLAMIPLNRLKDVGENEAGYPEFSMFGELPSWAFYVRHVDGLTMKNITVRAAEKDFRPAFVFDDVDKLDLNTITIGKANNNAPVILSHVTRPGIQKVITPGFSGNPVKTISSVYADLHAQATQIVYLSGTDKDHTVNWDFLINTGQKNGSWNKIAVPSNWELQGFGTYNYFQDTKNPDEQGLYKYHFSTDTAWSKKKVFIVFEGAMTDTKVMINGLLAGPIHQGGYYRFKYDITNLLKTGDNLLEVDVSKKSANASINLAERRADFWQFGGIYRPVYLEIVPANYIDHMAIDAKADGNITVDVYAPEIKNDNLITAQLQTLEGQEIGNELIQEAVNGEFPISLKGSYKTIVPWNPEFPTLYNLVVSIIDKNGRVIHTVTQRFGFRTMELRLHDGIYVNGKKVMLKGVCRHSEWPESGRTLSKAISIMDVNLMKDMNMNAVRMSHYPPDQHFLDVCDSLGLFVLDELTGWQNKYDTVVGKKLVKEMVVRDVNHPAIIFWDNGNEGGWNTALDDQFKLYDPQNRVVLHPWEKFNGTDTRHYPDYNYVVNSALYGNDVFFPTEFMHGNYDGGAGAGLEDFWNAIVNHPYGAGGFIWVFADGGIRRVDEDSTMDTANDSAPDGILGPHREKEASFYTIKELWSPVVINKKLITPPFDGRIAVENRYSYTNLNQCTFKWRLVTFPAATDTGIKAITGAEQDLPKFNLAPGEKGFLQLDLPRNWIGYDALYLTAADPHGREVFTWTWPIILPDQVKKPVISSATPNITADDSATSLVVHSSGVNYFFNKANGQLQKVVTSKNEISLTGPVEAGFNHRLVKLKSYVDGANYIVEPIYEGDTYFTVKWTFAPGKAVELRYQYTLEKHWSQQTGVDFAGISFKYPEGKITGMKWLGRGPYRVWKNRLKGQQFGVWHKDYNNTITGTDWSYPEFKGYHADFYWVVIENKESPFTVYTDDQSIFLQMLKPDHSRYEHESLKAAFPEGDIGFLNSIAPIGTRFQNPSLLGPESQKSIQLNYGIVKGTLWFDFR